METSLPKWADPMLSRDLPGLREAGECETIEFKEMFPEQAHRIAKDLAAFGTSGAGLMLIGVNDNGDLVGIDADNGDERNDAIHRAQNIASAIRPDLKVDFSFAVEAGKTVLVIGVAEQEEPEFYYEGRPYVRDGRSSRPATPDEVKTHVWAHPSSHFQREEERIALERKQLLLDMSKQQQQSMAENARRSDELEDRMLRSYGL